MIESVHISQLDWGRVALGLLIAEVGGFVAAGIAVSIARGKEHFADGVWIGLFERLFFTLSSALLLTGTVAAMIAWIGAKMAAGWNLVPDDPEDGAADGAQNSEKRTKKKRFGALTGGLASMLFALVGGLVASGRVGW